MRARGERVGGGGGSKGLAGERSRVRAREEKWEDPVGSDDD